MEYFVELNSAEGSGDGSKSAPYHSVDQVFKALGSKLDQKLDYKIFLNDPDGWKEISKAQIKKYKKAFVTKPTKTSKEIVQVSENFEDIRLDTSLPEPICTTIDQIKSLSGKRVMIKGWVQHIRKQSKKLWFIKLRDGSGYVQCVLETKLCNTKEASQLICESSIKVYGTLREVSSKNKSTENIELVADYWEYISRVKVPGGIESVINADSEPDVQFNNRHLMMRGENTSKVIKMHSIALRAFRMHYEKNNFLETIPPVIVNTSCEGGSTLFKFDYFGEEAYLSQSSQLYLETFVPSLGKCYAITRSYRAEKSRTRRHLSEYNHVEAESGFITFEDLLNQIEDLLVDVSKIVLELGGQTLLEINPGYKPLEKPFLRMEYKDAITFLEENNIEKPEGGKYEFGDDIPEAAERKMTDIIKKPIMLMRFPAELKAFYMSRCSDDRRVTESVDVLIPGVGEIVGGSMRIWDYEELMAAYEREKIDPKPYYWYTDLRKFGSFPHGGYGLGFERFLTWMMNKDHIRDVCAYPRYTGRCDP